jgi:hypothetical protein
MDAETQRKQKKTLRRLARRARADLLKEEAWELMEKRARTPLAPDVYQPFSRRPSTEDEVITAPAWLVGPEEPKKPLSPFEEVKYETARRLDKPFLVTADYVLHDDVKKLLASYCAVYRQLQGIEKCGRCNNTGVSRWRARGAAANVCKCVRIGATSLATGYSDEAPRG